MSSCSQKVGKKVRFWKRHEQKQKAYSFSSISENTDSGYCLTPRKLQHTPKSTPQAIPRSPTMKEIPKNAPLVKVAIWVFQSTVCLQQQP